MNTFRKRGYRIYNLVKHLVGKKQADKHMTTEVTHFWIELLIT
jgi:hypothetical protein